MSKLKTAKNVALWAFGIGSVVTTCAIPPNYYLRIANAENAPVITAPAATVAETDVAAVAADTASVAPPEVTSADTSLASATTAETPAAPAQPDFVPTADDLNRYETSFQCPALGAGIEEVLAVVAEAAAGLGREYNVLQQQYPHLVSGVQNTSIKVLAFDSTFDSAIKDRRPQDQFTLHLIRDNTLKTAEVRRLKRVTDGLGDKRCYEMQMYINDVELAFHGMGNSFEALKTDGAAALDSLRKQDEARFAAEAVAEAARRASARERMRAGREQQRGVAPN